MAEACPPDCRDWVGVVAEDLPEPTSAKGDVAEFLEPVNCEGEKDGDEGGGETVCDGAVVETD